jgi:anaerobic dimethyl sulfoxide reductase subunit B (iron-sulfur subunit)
MRGGFAFDPELCIKCWACEIACKQWNGISSTAPSRRRVFELVEGTFPQVKRTFISLGCMHCDDAPCARVCPTGAVHRREDGIVAVDQAKCIGCKHCLRACPYGIPQYEGGVMDKCDCCLGAEPSLGQPRGIPHCVSTCPTRALTFGADDDAVRAYEDLARDAMRRIADDPDSLVW